MNQNQPDALFLPYDRQVVRILIAQFAREAQINPALVRRVIVELFEQAFYRRQRQLRQRGEAPCAFDLAAVHRFEQRVLLRLALEIQLAASAGGRLLSAAPRTRVSEEYWQARCAQEIGCALADGARVDGELLACAMQKRRHWSSALRLAQHLQSVSEDVTDRWYLVRALFAAGRWSRAREAAQLVDSSCLTRERRSSLLECLALDLEQRGSQRAALTHFEAAAVLGGQPRTDLGAALLAIELGAREALERSLARLEAREDSLVAGSAALHELVAKREWMQRSIGEACLHELKRLLRAHCNQLSAQTGRCN